MLTVYRTYANTPLEQASGTTLGADNGIGVCAALALLDMPQAAKLPPLECLFTVDEETGLTGAFQLDASMLSGARQGLWMGLCLPLEASATKLLGLCLPLEASATKHLACSS